LHRWDLAWQKPLVLNSEARHVPVRVENRYPRPRNTLRVFILLWAETADTDGGAEKTWDAICRPEGWKKAST
jgi:hypothetical protein